MSINFWLKLPTFEPFLVAANAAAPSLGAGGAAVQTLSVRGKFTSYTGGFTTVLGLAFDAKRRLYVLEVSAAPGFPAPGAGKIVRINASGQREDFVTGLAVPNGITMGPDGALYVSNFGAAPPGLGQILRITNLTRF